MLCFCIMKVEEPFEMMLRIVFFIHVTKSKANKQNSIRTIVYFYTLFTHTHTHKYTTILFIIQLYIFAFMHSK